MKAWLRGSLSLSTAMLFVSACVLVEDFQGYEPLGTGGGGNGSACDNPPCPNANSSASSSGGGMGVGGTGGGSSSSGGTGGSGPIRCAKIPCNGSPCMPEVVVPDAKAGLLAVDSESMFLMTSAPNHIIRVPKPGCTIAAFDQAAQYPFTEQGLVSDTQYVAWVHNDTQNNCFSPSLKFCDPANCVPQEIMVPAIWSDQGAFGRLALGTDHLYFTMRNGLVGRVAKGSTQPEQLWIDPAYQLGAMKRGNTVFPAILNDKLFVVRTYIENGVDVCTGSPTADSGTIWMSNATPSANPTAVVENLAFPTVIAVSETYVYFHINDNVTVLHRIPSTGGTVEKIGTNGTISATLNGGSIFVNKGWVYFRVALPGMRHGIARLPAEAKTFTIDAAEVVVDSAYFRYFHVDDDALYWDECPNPPMCSGAYSMMARVMSP